MEATFYIDESGNTGTDWLNNAQPYFVYGGWLILNSNKLEIEKYLRDIVSTIQAPELKAKSILKGKSGTFRFNVIFKKMLDEHGALPVFGIVDKKFMISAKIVETFFDCEYNPAVNGYLTYPVELKKALATCIMNGDHNDNIIQSFSNLISNCTTSVIEMGKINQLLINLFIEQGHPIVADSLKALSQKNFEEMIDEFETVTRQGTKKSRITLTGTILLELLKNIELLSNNSSLLVNVNHDNLRGYDEVFQEFSNVFFRETPPAILGTQERFFLTNFPHIKSMNMVDSKKEVIIQAADLLCGFISKSFQTINNSRQLDEYSKDVILSLVRLHDEFIKDRVKIWNWYASYDFESNFFFTLNPNANIEKNKYHTIIQCDFSKALSVHS